jgi:tetratricopeptide (TPR) repeat protein
LEDNRMNRRIQALFVSLVILVILSGAGCGRGYSAENYLVWRIIKMPDGLERITFKGVADRWSIEILREDIVCFGVECLGRDTAARDDSRVSAGLIAVQFPPTDQESRMEAQRICKPLFPAYVRFALASLLGRTCVFHEIGRNDKAISEPADTDIMKPLGAAAYCDRGAVHTENGQYDQAISDYSKAIEMNPQFAKAFYDRGVAYYRKGQQNLAISDYARAIEINPQLSEQDDLFIRLIREKWARHKESQRS